MITPLLRQLVDDEIKLVNEHKEKYKRTGICTHLILGLHNPYEPPYHGCVICGKPVA